MKTPHKHAALIKAWADGAAIQVYNEDSRQWEDCEPIWWAWHQYRLKFPPNNTVNNADELRVEADVNGFINKLRSSVNMLLDTPSHNDFARGMDFGLNIVKQIAKEYGVKL